MSAARSWLGPSATHFRLTRSGVGLPSGYRRALSVQPRLRLRPRQPAARISRAIRVAYPSAPVRAIRRELEAVRGRIRCAVSRPDAFGRHRVGHASHTRRPSAPDVIAAGRNTQDAAHCAYRRVGLLRHCEFEEPTLLFLANQAVVFVRMSRSILSWQFSLRSRLTSSHSASFSPSLPGSGLPASRAAWATPLMIVRLLRPNSRDNSAGCHPACGSSMICRWNSIGYGALVFCISDSFSHKGRGSAAKGQRQLQAASAV